MQQEARHPQVVGHRDADARAHLVLPLGGHHLRVRAADLHARIQAGTVVGVDHLAAVHLVGADAAVVGSLRAGKAVLRPAERAAVDVEQCVLLRDG